MVTKTGGVRSDMMTSAQIFSRRSGLVYVLAYVLGPEFWARPWVWDPLFA